MKKKLILSHIFTFVLGAIIFGSSAYVIAAEIASRSVAYTGNGQNNVEGALNELYTRSKNWIKPAKLNNLGYYMNSAHTILANSEGIRIKRNGTVHLIKANDWTNEQTHVQQVFSDITCNVSYNSVECNATDFACFVSARGFAYCDDQSDGSRCYVEDGDYVECEL